MAARSQPRVSNREIGDPDACPVAATVMVIGGKWKPLIVYYLMRRTYRFEELRRRLTPVTQQMLTKQLRESKPTVS